MNWTAITSMITAVQPEPLVRFRVWPGKQLFESVEKIVVGIATRIQRHDRLVDTTEPGCAFRHDRRFERAGRRPRSLGAGAWNEFDAVSRVVAQVPGSGSLRHEAPGHTLYFDNSCARTHFDRYLADRVVPSR